jgi:Protein of unknown function (DUF2442)
MFPKLVAAKSLEKYRVWLKYSDQTQGFIDLSSLAHQGVFETWEHENLFEKVYIDKISNALAWNEEIDLCPDSLYLKLKGMSFEQWKKEKFSYATN